MTVVSMKAASSRPGIGDLVTRAGTIRTLVRQQAEQTEQARQVSAEAIEQMKQAGLFRIMTPAIYGGYEYGFDALVPVVAQVAAGCGSSGWVFSLGVVHQWLVATMPKEAQDEYWSDPDAISGGSYPPVGKVTRVDGGYRISGNWGFTSGCDHMQWLFLGGMIPPGSEGAPPSPAFFLLPRADVIFDDNWFTMGLSGTGSKTTVADDVFVPAHRVVLISDLLAGTTPGARVHGNPLYQQSMLSSLSFALVSPVLGMAEGTLADFIDMAKVRTTRGAVAGGNNRMAEFATIQSRVAEATGSIEAARLTISHALDKSRIAGEAGEQADREVRLPNRLAQAFSVKLLVHAIDALFAASGGQSIFTSKPIQRAWRDAHAAGVHVSMNWDAVSTMYGQHALGLDPKGQY
jgi:alkylation response protein AidB-like acyl-CoA dehydrogenase